MPSVYLLPVSFALCISLLLFPFLWAPAVALTSEGDACGITPADQCRKSECFVMLEQAPYVIVGSQGNWDRLRTDGFECAEFEKHNVDGIVMHLMENIWKNSSLKGPDEVGWRCYVGRKGCTFGEMVRWVARNDTPEEPAAAEAEDDWNLVMIGALLYTPERRQMNLGFSASIVDDELAVVARPREEDLAEDKYTVMLQPFDRRVWIAAASCLALCVLAGGLLKFSHPARHHYRSGNVRQFCHKPSRRDVVHSVMHTTAGALAVVFRVDGWEGDEGDKLNESDEGDKGQGLAHETDSDLDTAPQPGRTSYRLGLYNLVRLLLLLTLAFFYGTLLLFYQAALTNFLFQEGAPPLEQSVTKLTDPELQNYSVLVDTGVEEAWAGIQAENVGNMPIRSTGDFAPWKTCTDLDACFDQVRRDDSRHFVVEEAIAKYRISSQQLCGALTIFNPPEKLYHFNAGFLFGPRVALALKQHINIELLEDRLSDRIRNVTEGFVPNFECFPPRRKIYWKQYFVPTVLVITVFSVLIIGQIILILMNRRRPHQE